MSYNNTIYNDLSHVDVSAYMEKTLQKHNYISWVEALREMLARFGYDFTWIVHTNDEGLPYFKTDWDGAMVAVSTYIKDANGQTKERTQWHPVITHTNKPIEKPNTMQINTAIQRCLAKSIALHGLGLYIYAGEDLPPTEQNPDREDVTALKIEKKEKPSKPTVESTPQVSSDTIENRSSQVAKWKEAATKRGLTETDVDIIFNATLVSSERTFEDFVNPDITGRDEFANTMSRFSDSIKQSLPKDNK